MTYLSDNYYGGGGSGGSVKIMTTNFLGTGNITSRGGDSSPDGASGEGAGGIIDINTVNSNQIVNKDNPIYFTGILNVTKGYRNVDFSLFPSLKIFQAQNGCKKIVHNNKTTV